METLKKENGVVIIPSVSDVIYKELVDLLTKESTKEVQINAHDWNCVIYIKKDNILDYKFKILLSCRYLGTNEEVGLDEAMYIYPDEPGLVEDVETELFNILNYYLTEASYFYWEKFDKMLKKEEEYNPDDY